MYRHVLALLLINACYQISGYPMPSQPHSLGVSLSNLANHCKNDFLVNHIKSKIDECSMNIPPYGEKQLACLLFYEINSLLCMAVGSSNIALTEDYTAKINAIHDIDDLCNIGKNWKFANLTEYTQYKPLIEDVFKHPARCGIVCGDDELVDANFFCKYYNWGSEILKQQVKQSPKIPTAAVASTGSIVSKQTQNSAVSSPDDVQIKSDKVSESPEKHEAVAPEVANDKSTPTKPEETPKSTSLNTGAVKTTTSKQVIENVGENVQEPKVDQLDDPSTNLEVSSDVMKKDDSPPKKLEDKSIVNENAVVDRPLPNGIEKPVLSNSKQKNLNSDIDYPDAGIDSMEGKEGMMDAKDGDDGDDPDIDPENKLDTNVQVADIIPEQAKTFDKKEEPILPSNTGESSQREIADVIDDDDDHFFTFFLTAIIIVVVLYILYHNKNKVSKVFFGLLLEGRQRGRRRNSRGHAYRRLDTLEQAMSANTTAPPSKIIY